MLFTNILILSIYKFFLFHNYFDAQLLWMWLSVTHSI